MDDEVRFLRLKVERLEREKQQLLDDSRMQSQFAGFLFRKYYELWTQLLTQGKTP